MTAALPLKRKDAHSGDDFVRLVVLSKGDEGLEIGVADMEIILIPKIIWFNNLESLGIVPRAVMTHGEALDIAPLQRVEPQGLLDIGLRVRKSASKSVERRIVRFIAGQCRHCLRAVSKEVLKHREHIPGLPSTAVLHCPFERLPRLRSEREHKVNRGLLNRRKRSHIVPEPRLPRSKQRVLLWTGIKKPRRLVGKTETAVKGGVLEIDLPAKFLLHRSSEFRS